MAYRVDKVSALVFVCNCWPLTSITKLLVLAVSSPYCPRGAAGLSKSAVGLLHDKGR